MYNHRLYAKGIQSVLLVEWSLKCETPLAIRNGKALSYSEGAQQAKTREYDLNLRWALASSERQDQQRGPGRRENKPNTEAELAGLAYGYVVEDGRVVSYHFVPPSSVRGALRSWTLRNLLHPDLRGKLNPPARGDETGRIVYLADLKRALENRRHGYEVVASLFGLAADVRAGEEIPSNAGRLTVETERFDTVEVGDIDASGISVHAVQGPQNVRRQLRVRNPLDRITHGSKAGGLHHFLEICRGETFLVRMSIANPLDCDIGLLSLWQRELDDGMLRLGALSSIGRGRVSVAQATYTLWRCPTAPPLAGMEHWQACDEPEPGDALAGIWQSYSLPSEKLAQFRPYLEAYV